LEKAETDYVVVIDPFQPMIITEEGMFIPVAMGDTN